MFIIKKSAMPTMFLVFGIINLYSRVLSESKMFPVYAINKSYCSVSTLFISDCGFCCHEKCLDLVRRTCAHVKVSTFIQCIAFRVSDRNCRLTFLFDRSYFSFFISLSRCFISVCFQLYFVTGHCCCYFCDAVLF